ncbi:MAG TPA: hypothetical protein VFX96_12725 [Pyrinomonadaceae bacterium]|nr:hypothetical protein [Pyrinomonadaceae bacterium]
MSRSTLARLLQAAALVCAAALVAACGNDAKDAEVNAVVKDLDAFTQELLAKVKSAPDPSTGVDEAQRHLDARRAEMAAKMNSIKDVREAQLSEETRKRLMERVTENVMSVSGLQIEYMDESLRDPAFKAKIEKLTQDYQTLFNR